MTARPKLRCAIYTRKSSDEGLDQAFNSLDAQREAGEAYVKSQSAEGWKLLPTLYDDGGFSGGSMERPGLQRLLADVDAGRIDVVVVYKIDRLTRALADFARIVERFDARGVSFVSVTQSFNTTSSMGRLTLNVLLSFAQFEREVTGERIRDKIAASKAKGLWMGGLPPLGYDIPAPGERVLRVNSAEAETVRHIFARYLALGSVHGLMHELAADGICSKARVTRSGRQTGGLPLGRGALFHMLRNRIYLGEIRHSRRSNRAGDKATQEIVWYPGGHEGIVDPATFDAAQALLDGQVRRTATTHPSTLAAHNLAGRLFDAAGNAMSPTHSRGRAGKIYRYYVSTPLQKGQAKPASSEHTLRISSIALERTLTTVLSRLLPGECNPLDAICRIEIHTDRLILTLPRELAANIQPNLAPDEALHPDPAKRKLYRLTLSIRFSTASGRTRSTERPSSGQRDPVLIAALKRAHLAFTRDAHGPRMDAAPPTQYARRLATLALLAPDIQRDILDGKQPPHLNLEALLAIDIPLDWQDQRKALGWGG